MNASVALAGDIALTGAGGPPAEVPVGLSALAPSPDDPVNADAQRLAAVVRRARNGEDGAFTELVGLCTGRLFHFLCRLTGNPHDAEDLAQETFIKAHRSLHRFHLERAFLPWLFTIARRTALNHFRGRRPEEPLNPELPAPDARPAPDDALQANDDHAALWDLAARLKPKHQQVLWLYYGENFAVADVARVMRLTRIHVKVLLHRARQALAQEMTRTEIPSIIQLQRRRP
jgi:RNA polymerase sigma-70 factor (ECF subfamily)